MTFNQPTDESADCDTATEPQTKAMSTDTTTSSEDAQPEQKLRITFDEPQEVKEVAALIGGVLLFAVYLAATMHPAYSIAPGDAEQVKLIVYALLGFAGVTEAARFAQKKR